MAEDIKVRLTAARDAKAKRDADTEAEKERRELATLDLEEKWEKELGGKRGEAFEIVDGGTAGLIVLAVKQGGAVFHKQFMASAQKEITLEACQRWTMACVVEPAPTELVASVGERVGIYTVCANKLVALYEGGRFREMGK